MPITHISAQQLRELFMFEKPYIIQFEHRKREFARYKPSLTELINNNEVELIEKTNKSKTYKLK